MRSLLKRVRRSLARCVRREEMPHIAYRHTVAVTQPQCRPKIAIHARQSRHIAVILVQRIRCRTRNVLIIVIHIGKPRPQQQRQGQQVHLTMQPPPPQFTLHSPRQSQGRTICHSGARVAKRIVVSEVKTLTHRTTTPHTPDAPIQHATQSLHTDHAISTVCLHIPHSDT